MTRTPSLWESDRLSAADAAGEGVSRARGAPAKLPPQERAEEPPAQRPPRGPDHVEVAHAIFAYARRISYRRLHIGDIVIEAGRGWMGFVYSPNVTWEQRLQVYQIICPGHPGWRTVSGSHLCRRWCSQSDEKG